MNWIYNLCILETSDVLSYDRKYTYVGKHYTTRLQLATRNGKGTALDNLCTEGVPLIVWAFVS